MIREIITRRQELAVECKVLENEKLQKTIVEDLTDTIKSLPNCVALSANQIGYNVRAFVVQQNKKVTVFINPGILARNGGKKTVQESCLSQPGQTGTVKRHAKIRLEYTDVDGEPRKEEFSGKSARFIQHMLNHINGQDCLQGVKNESAD